LEGFSARKEGSHPNRLAVADQGVDGELLIQFNLAGTSSHLHTAEPEDHIPEVADLPFLERKDVPCLPHGGKPPSHFGAPSVNGTLHRRGASGHPFNVRRRIAEPEVSVVLIPGFDPATHDLDVR